MRLEELAGFDELLSATLEGIGRTIRARAVDQRGLEALHRLEWSYISPASVLAPGERTGVYRVGGRQVLRDAEGRSYISMEDYAIALVDEAESPTHVRQRFTVAQ